VGRQASVIQLLVVVKLFRFGKSVPVISSVLGLF